MDNATFNGLKRGDVLRSATGKTYVVQRSVDDALEASGHYVYASRCNSVGTTEGLTAREASCGVAIRAASKNWSKQ